MARGESAGRGEERRRGERRARKPYEEGLSFDERWDEIVSRAIEIGIDEERFWNLTDRELVIAARGHDRRATREGLFVAWHTAALLRVEHLPSMAELLAPPKTPEQLEAERLQREIELQELLRRHKKAAAFNQAVRKTIGG